MIRNPKIRLLAVSLLATQVVGAAFAEMVYDDETSMSAAPTSVEVRNVINAPAPIAVTPEVVVETTKIQKTSEKSRERRGFQESVNNELVIQKLEDKRLKQEEKLTAEINRQFNLDAEPAGTVAPVLKEEKVVKPITEATDDSYGMSAAPVSAKKDDKAVRAIVQDELASYQSSTNISVAPVDVKAEAASSEATRVSITPRAGLSAISNDFFEMRNQYSLGAGVGFDVSDHVALDLGYTFANYQVGLRNAPVYGGFQLNQLTYKSNTIDAGVRFYLTGVDSKVRPFLGGGLAYSIGYVNYNRNMMYNPYLNSGQDYQLNQFQGALQAGIDFKISSGISIGLTYKLMRPLSTSETQNGLYTSAFYNPYGMGMGGAFIDPTKQAVRYSLRDSTTQMFLIGASVTF
jgi:opacity protein-like surface antigen